MLLALPLPKQSHICIVSTQYKILLQNYTPSRKSLVILPRTLSDPEPLSSRRFQSLLTQSFLPNKKISSRDLHSGLHCIRSYTRRCMNIHQRDHFNKLYHGTNEVIHELCEEGPYQEGTYVLYELYPCFMNHHQPPQNHHYPPPHSILPQVVQIAIEVIYAFNLYQ